MTTDVVFTVSIPYELERIAKAQSEDGLVRSKILTDAIYNLHVFNQLNPEGMQNSLILENGVKVSWEIPKDKEQSDNAEADQPTKTLKLGDRVIAVKYPEHYADFKIGDKGTLIDIDHDDNALKYCVVFDKDVKKRFLWTTSEQIELIEQPEVVGKVIKGGKHIPKFYLDDDDVHYPKQFPSFEDSHQKINELVYHQDVKGIYDYFAQFGVREVEVLPSNIRKTLIEFIDSIRAYEDEAGHSIYDDERDSSEFVDIFLQDYDLSKTVKNVEVFPEVGKVYELYDEEDDEWYYDELVSFCGKSYVGASIRPIQPSRIDELKARKSELSDTEKDELIELLIKEKG